MSQIPQMRAREAATLEPVAGQGPIDPRDLRAASPKLLPHVGCQSLGGHIPRRRSPALLLNQSRVEETPQIIGRSGRRNVGLRGVCGAVGSVKETLLERDDKPVRPPAFVYELLEIRPSFARFVELSEAPASLGQVRFDAQANERRCIALRIVRAPLHLL
jgi:hypothetical protein